MKPPTEEEAERYAHACGWTYLPLKVYCDKNVSDMGPVTLGPMWIPQQGVSDYTKFEKELPLDPYFWFPRLWERLRQKHRESLLGLGMVEGSRSACFGTQLGRSLEDDCMTLCESIEALEVKNGNPR